MIEDPAWKTREKVITIIERHLSQDAKIERDVKLPVLNRSSGDKRQCDIVIREGVEPRQTISIVEVQKRMAHSTFFFSKNLEIVQYEKLNGIQMEFQHIVRQNKNNQLPNPTNKIFRINAEKLVSINDMMDWHLFGTPKNLLELPKNQLITLTVNFKPNFGELEFLTPEGSWVMLNKLILQIRLIIREELVTWEAATYEQKGWGEIGWVLKGNAIIDSKKIEIVIPLKKTIPGEYVMGRPITLGNYDTFVSLGEIGFKSEQFKDKST